MQVTPCKVLARKSASNCEKIISVFASPFDIGPLQVAVERSGSPLLLKVSQQAIDLSNLFVGTGNIVQFLACLSGNQPGPPLRFLLAALSKAFLSL